MQNNFVQPHHYFKTYPIDKYPRGINALILQCHPRENASNAEEGAKQNQEKCNQKFPLEFSVSVRDLPLLDCPLEQCFLALC
jgi:hypothetical protein